jgi:hypothetical protein
VLPPREAGLICDLPWRHQPENGPEIGRSTLSPPLTAVPNQEHFKNRPFLPPRAGTLQSAPTGALSLWQLRGVSAPAALRSPARVSWPRRTSCLPGLSCFPRVWSISEKSHCALNGVGDRLSRPGERRLEHGKTSLNGLKRDGRSAASAPKFRGRNNRFANAPSPMASVVMINRTLSYTRDLYWALWAPFRRATDYTPTSGIQRAFLKENCEYYLCVAGDSQAAPGLVRAL